MLKIESDGTISINRGDTGTITVKFSKRKGILKNQY